MVDTYREEEERRRKKLLFPTGEGEFANPEKTENLYAFVRSWGTEEE